MSDQPVTENLYLTKRSSHESQTFMVLGGVIRTRNPGKLTAADRVDAGARRLYLLSTHLLSSHANLQTIIPRDTK
jgi:hypothetical protein